MIPSPQFSYWAGGDPVADPAKAAYDFWHEHIFRHFELDPHVEHCLALYLGEDRCIAGYSLIAGYAHGVYPTLADLIPPPIPAKALVLLHSHPEDCEVCPSSADFAFTAKLDRHSRTFDVELLDHVIVGFRTVGNSIIDAGCYYSFKENHHILERPAPTAT